MWVQSYDSGALQQPRPWATLISALDTAPIDAHSASLRATLVQLLTEELARDPELEEVYAASQLLDLAEQSIAQALPWYGDVLRFQNTCLTGWTPQAHFLVQDDDRVGASVEALLDATERLPAFVRTLEAAFGPVRAGVRAGGVPIPAIEVVVDAVVAATDCRAGWAQTLFAALRWMHEAAGVPLPEARRRAMADWLAQSCLPGIPPSPMARAEILAAMARSLRRPVRY